jgi:outer membrane protein assembly factor BamB
MPSVDRPDSLSPGTKQPGTPAVRAFSLLACWILLFFVACGREPKLAAQAPVAPSPLKRVVGEDWPRFLGPRNDGTSAEKTLDPSRWQPIPPIVWTIPLGVSYGAPTISNGQLFLFERIGELEQLTCYEVETAKQLWKFGDKVQYDDMFGYNNGPRCSPIVDDERVYLYGVTGRLSCVDVRSGELKWSRDLNQEYDVVPNFFGVASNPYIFENLVLVMVGGSTPETRHLPTERLAQVKPNGTAIVAFDKMTGQEVYHVGQDLASYSSVLVQDIQGKPTGLAFLREGLLAWEPQTGKELFRFPWRAPMLESVNAAQPLVSDDRILISEAYEVGSVLLDIEQGVPSVVWQDGGPRSSCRFRAHWSTPVIVDGYLYGCSGRNGPDTDFRCVRLSDGEVMWTDRSYDRQRSSLLWVDGYLIVLGENGLLELVKPNPEKIDILASANLAEVQDQASGQPLLEHPCWAAPVLSHGLLFVRGNQRLVCVDLIPTVSAQ